MKNPELFHKTIGILVNAYLNDTLQHGNCYACAVGNIIASAKNIGFKPSDFVCGKIIWDQGVPNWQAIFMTFDGEQTCYPGVYNSGFIKQEIDITGYLWNELALIEKAFETAENGGGKEQYMYNGLMAVVDVLCEIHEMDLTAQKEAKALFVKAA